MKKIAATLLFIGFTQVAPATIINIPGDYPAIQQGIDAGVDGDTVLVQPGTYVENINFNGHNVVLGSLLLTTGDPSYISQTIIDGDSSGTVISLAGGEDSSTCITGFTLTNGYTDGYGGGILCQNHSNPAVSYNIIEDNISYNSGAGICCRQSSPTILKNTISNNRIYNIFRGDGGGIHIYESSSLIRGNTISDNYCFCAGGGISCFASNPVIIDNVISGNNTVGPGAGFACHQSQPVIRGNVFTNNISASDEGGAVACYSCSMIFEGNLVAYNVSGFRGGGIFNNYSDSYIRNNIIVYNQCAYDGAAIHCRRTWSRSNPTIINNVIYGNEAGGNGGALAIVYADPIIFNTIMRNNTPDEIDCDNLSNPVITYSDIQGGWEGEGNIDADPLFRDIAADDFHLMAAECGDPHDSPCRDSGSPLFQDSLLDCSWGLGGLRSDMGAYGGGDSATAGINDNSSLLPNEIYLMQNFPNPFNSETRIKFSIVNSIEVRLAIYDLLGREVQILIDDYCPAGEYAVNFKGAGIPSGIYFYSLRTGDSIETKKMLLLK
jgi:parallel beta-helix repeat protein